MYESFDDVADITNRKVPMNSIAPDFSFFAARSHSDAVTGSCQR